MEYIITFLEGSITFLSPCMLPMLPIYLSFFAGDSGKKGAFPRALAFVGGFSVVFIAMGAFAGTLGSLLKNHMTAVNLIGGGVVVLMGLQTIGLFQLSFLKGIGWNPLKHKSPGMVASFLFGAVYAVGWTPCVGAFLGSALMLAASVGGSLKGILLLLAYSAGLGVPFILSALLLEKLKDAFGWVKKHYAVVNIVAGSFLILMGLAMMTGILNRFLAILTP